MYAVVIFPYTKSIQVIPVKWVLNFDKKILKKDLQNEEKKNCIKVSLVVHKSQHNDVIL
jgi:hypothetical protein